MLQKVKDLAEMVIGKDRMVIPIVITTLNDVQVIDALFDCEEN